MSVEGSELAHCVSSYGGSCATGKIAIYSLQHTKGGITERRLTIEIDVASNKIAEARKKYNKSPNNEDVSILRKWASKEFLSVAGWIR